QRRVELDAEAPVYADPVIVVHPGHAEDDLAFGLADALNQGIIRIFGMLGDHAPQASQHFLHRLEELGLARIPTEDIVQDGLQFFVDHIWSRIVGTGALASNGSHRNSRQKLPFILWDCFARSVLSASRSDLAFRKCPPQNLWRSRWKRSGAGISQ